MSAGRKRLSRYGAAALLAALARATPKDGARIDEQTTRGHEPSARQWFQYLAPHLFVVAPKTGRRTRSSFRNVIVEGELR